MKKEEKIIKEVKNIKVTNKNNISCLVLVLIFAPLIILSISDPYSSIESFELYYYFHWAVPVTVIVSVGLIINLLSKVTTIKTLGICPHCNEEIDITNIPYKNINDRKSKFSCPNCEKDIYILKSNK